MQKTQRKLALYLCKKWYSLAIPLMVLVSASFCMFDASVSALTTVPTKTNFQGRLTNSVGNIMPDGTYNMRFRLYTVSSGGSAVWSEDRLVSATQGVQVTNGLFSVRLGDITPLAASLFASGALYFEVELPTPGTATSSSPSWTEGPMTPRNQLATSAYAYNAETLDGYDSSDFGRLVANNTWSGTNTFSNSVDATGSYFHYVGGAGSDFGVVADSVGIATGALLVADPSSNILFSTSSNGTVRVGSLVNDAVGTVLILDTKNTSGDPTGVSATNGATYYNSNTGKFRCYQNSAWRDCTSSLQDGYDLSIGSTTPEIKLDSTRGGLDIQDANTTIGAGGLLNVRASNGSGLGSALFSVGNTGAITAQNSADSTSAFTISRSGSGCSLFVADTSNSRVQIGSATADATGVVLVLDTKNNAGDPTGVDGAMYYNSSMHAFRCYQDGVWRSCMGGLVYANTSPSTTLTGTTETAFSTSHTIPAGSCQNGKVYRVNARGVINTYNPGLGNPGTVTIRVKLGGTTLGTALSANLTSGMSNRGWVTDFNITCVNFGSNLVEGQGVTSVSTTSTAAQVIDMPNTATISVPSLASAQAITLTMDFSNANAGNTITLRQMVVEELGP